MKVYPWGYGAHARAIKQMMQEHPRLVLIDTRKEPRTHWKEWHQESLRALYGKRYRYGGHLLGNCKYRTPGVIEIVDLEQGVEILCHWLLLGYDLLPLCGCSQYEGCHLRVIVEALLKKMPEVEVVLPPVQQALLPFS